MKTGEPKQRLSEKLNADMERIRAENAASIDAQLQSFRTDLKTIAENALATIKTDTEGYLLRVRKHLMRQSANAARPEWKALMWPMLVACCLMISAGVSTWTVMTWLMPNLNTMGLRVIERPEATYLIPRSGRAVLARCSLAGEPVDCLMIPKE
ncbi:hypothetical protein FIU89_03480 [Roseovarius sp. THAF27]|uniref:Uncharacterized protein n=2 Tax=Sulfitobacter TaxID=60136 RepID=A0A1J0WIX7_9RHOB|nr:hypothetical protein [Roseovarius sp. THAF27]APE44273.1 hypothetical protein BOO69_13350 [Sulfitobacter alexandrii]QFT47597.1 hypothetical protein FIU97_13535 [Roseivivax sp. THAF40]QFT79659.1 hypothetical protein FIU89_03480 [Roseovarius sp. THAF27]UOA15614.1 hypothetical protein DSM109990_02457 [Sulfitobacter dubius]